MILIRVLRGLGAVTLVCASLAMTTIAVAKPRTVEYTRSVFRMDEGTVWGHISSGANCETERERFHWTREGSELHTERLGTIFHQAMVDIGAAPQDDNLFEDSTPAADLQIAAAISDMRASVCEQPGLYGYRGSLSMTVQWQVYDPAARQLVGKFETHATGQTSQATQSGLDGLFVAAFRSNARDLMSDSGFQKVLKQPASTTVAATGPVGAATSQRIAFAPAAGSAPKTPPQAVQSVVLVQTNDAHGSGFLISPDGYILTNQHVVGSSRTVRIRWADGTEGPGQVLRADRERDVALIKASAPPAPALSFRAALPAQGDQVFAVGAPVDPSLQGTLTRGIVSANRVIGGKSFIQSDVAVTHGNSGGPLLNEHGEVVGMTDLAITDHGTAVSLNMFIPIGDALRVLSLDAAPGKTVAPAAPLTQQKPRKR